MTSAHPAATDIAVAVNMLWCVPGRVGGSEEYLVRQLLGLAEPGEASTSALAHFAVTIYAPRGFRAAHPDLGAVHRIVEAPIDGSNRVRRVIAEHTWLARRTAGSALVHHGGGTMPRRGTQPTVLTIHDLQHLTFPQYVHPVKRLYLARSIPSSVKRATVIAVPSEYVRGTVIDAYGCDPAAVVVVPHGIEPALGVDATPEAVLREKYHLGGGSILVLPAITHPHKGHRFLLRVMARHWPDPDVRLVLLGGRGAAEDDVIEAIADLGLRDRVVRAGRVCAADRDGLLRIATAMVFPSEHEGFGAPVIEAMTLGAPVICSDRTALAEVAGDAAIVLPLDVDAWATALEDVTARRDELIAAGLRRAAEFTSERSGAALREAYALTLR